jgi:ABC-2 type transport system permease protein
VNDHHRGRFWLAWLLGLAVAGICVAANYALLGVEKRADLTEDKRYTLPEPLIRIAEKLDRNEPVKVTVYLSESLPQVISHLTKALQTRLGEIRRASNGGLEYEFVDPKEDTDLVQKLDKDEGIKALSIPDVRHGTQTFGNYYLSLLLRRGDKKEVAHLAELSYELAKEESTLSALSPFLAARLVKLTAEDASAIGIVSEKKQMPPQPGQQPQEPKDFLDAIRRSMQLRATVQDVTLKNGLEVPKNIKALLVYRPENLTDLELYQLDQFLMRGGGVIVLYDNWSAFDVDRMTAINGAFQRQNYSLREIKSGMNDWLAHYGFRISPGLVHDRSNFTSSMLTQMPNGMPGMQTMTLAGVVNVKALDADKKPTGQIDQSEPSVAGLSGLPFVLPAPMQTDSDAEFALRHPGSKLSAFLRTSPEAWAVTEVKDTLQMSNLQPPSRDQWGSYVLGARATGPLKSYFAGKPVPTREGAPTPPTPVETLAEASAERPGQLWVIADSDFACDVWASIFGRSMQNIALAQALGRSQSMLMNVVDVAALGGGLVEMRRPRLLDRSVDAERVKEDRSEILFLNIWMMPLALVVFGLLRWWWRTATTFVASPRQPVDVGAGVKTPPPPSPPHDPSSPPPLPTSETHQPVAPAHDPAPGAH